MVFYSCLTGLEVGNMLILSLSICKQTHTKVSEEKFLKSEIMKCGEKKGSVLGQLTVHMEKNKLVFTSHYT